MDLQVRMSKNKIALLTFKSIDGDLEALYRKYVIKASPGFKNFSGGEYKPNVAEKDELPGEIKSANDFKFDPSKAQEVVQRRASETNQFNKIIGSFETNFIDPLPRQQNFPPYPGSQGPQQPMNPQMNGQPMPPYPAQQMGQPQMGPNPQ
jgi:hypothetical protein